MTVRHLRNISLSTFESFLELAQCKCMGINSGHVKYTRADLRRPVIIQTHIDPVPEFIIKNALRSIQVSRSDFYDILEGKKVVVKKGNGYSIVEQPGPKNH